MKMARPSRSCLRVSSPGRRSSKAGDALRLERALQLEVEPPHVARDEVADELVPVPPRSALPLEHPVAERVDLAVQHVEQVHLVHLAAAVAQARGRDAVSARVRRRAERPSLACRGMARSPSARRAEGAREHRRELAARPPEAALLPQLARGDSAAFTAHCGTTSTAFCLLSLRLLAELVRRDSPLRSRDVAVGNGSRGRAHRSPARGNGPAQDHRRGVPGRAPSRGSGAFDSSIFSVTPMSDASTALTLESRLASAGAGAQSPGAARAPPAAPSARRRPGGRAPVLRFGTSWRPRPRLSPTLGPGKKPRLVRAGRRPRS